MLGNSKQRSEGVASSALMNRWPKGIDTLATDRRTSSLNQKRNLCHNARPGCTGLGVWGPFTNFLSSREISYWMPPGDAASFSLVSDWARTVRAPVAPPEPAATTGRAAEPKSETLWLLWSAEFLVI